MQRSSRKKGALSPLDLYDEAEFSLEKSGNGQVGFLKDYDLIERRAEIGNRYNRLELAARLSIFLQSNPVHEGNNESIYKLAIRSFDSLRASDAIEAILIKTLYLYSRDEGYPVKEDWFNSLPSLESQWAKAVLNSQLRNIELDTNEQSVILESIENYITRFTEIKLGY